MAMARTIAMEVTAVSSSFKPGVKNFSIFNYFRIINNVCLRLWWRAWRSWWV